MLSFGEYLRQSSTRPDADGSSSSGDVLETTPRQIEKHSAQNQWWENGFLAGQADLEQRLIGTRKEMEDQFAHTLQLERERLSDEMLKDLQTRHMELMDDFTRRVSETVARLLSPFLAEAGVRRMTSELTVMMHELANDRAREAIYLSGSRDLIERLGPALEGIQDLMIMPDDRTDLVLSSGPTRIEARVEDWIRLIWHESGEQIVG